MQIDQASLAGPRKNSAPKNATLLFVPRRKTCVKVYFCDRCDVVIYTVLLRFTNTFLSVGPWYAYRSVSSISTDVGGDEVDRKCCGCIGRYHSNFRGQFQRYNTNFDGKTRICLPIGKLYVQLRQIVRILRYDPDL